MGRGRYSSLDFFDFFGFFWIFLTFSFFTFFSFFFVFLRRKKNTGFLSLKWQVFLFLMIRALS